MDIRKKIEESPKEKLVYSVHRWSSYSSIYYPHNILMNRPTDQACRWSSDTNTPPQFLILKLQRPSIVTAITFGKYEKTHVCNLRKFKIFAGTCNCSRETFINSDFDNSPKGMEDNFEGVVEQPSGSFEYDDEQNVQFVEILEGGLHNTTNEETFDLKHFLQISENDGAKKCNVPLVSSYVKLLPLQSWGPSFNFSIWYVELHGIDDSYVVQSSRKLLSAHREKCAFRLCLKFLRERGHIDIFNELQARSNIYLERDDRLKNLWNQIVARGDFQEAENLIDSWVMLDDGSDSSESFMVDQEGTLLFQNYGNKWMRRAVWEQVIPSSSSHKAVSSDAAYSSGSVLSYSQVPALPSMRGGHQMVLDPSTDTIYLFGGWDGHKNLNDMWEFSITKNSWTRICEDAEKQMQGPSPRSCHKMCMDPVSGKIFCLGRYVDSSTRIVSDVYLSSGTEEEGEGPSASAGDNSSVAAPELNMKSDFWAFDVKSKTWSLISENTAAENGPSLMCDHQMAIDVSFSTIYVFGGRILSHSSGSANRNENTGGDAPEAPNQPGPSAPPRSIFYAYSGLYSYSILRNEWTLLKKDFANNEHSNFDDDKSILSRVGHSMLFHPKLRKLYVLGGQRGKLHLDQFFSIDVDSGAIEELPSKLDVAVAASAENGDPPSTPTPTWGLTQRATIDIESNEIFVFSGLSKDKTKRDVFGTNNTFSVFKIDSKKWSRFPFGKSNLTSSSSCSSLMDCIQNNEEPCQRFAHQILYNPKQQVHYLFGGNPGKTTDSKLRLDDFWKLKFFKCNYKDELLRQCKLLLRKQRFTELTRLDSVKALKYLQTSVAELIDHNDSAQTQEFQSLTSLLFFQSPTRKQPKPMEIGECSIDKEGKYSHLAKATLKHRLPTSVEEDHGTDDEDDIHLMSHKSPQSSEPESCMSSMMSQDPQVLMERSDVFDRLMRYFPEHMTQPRKNLEDIIPV